MNKKKALVEAFSGHKFCEVLLTALHTAMLQLPAGTLRAPPPPASNWEVDPEGDIRKWFYRQPTMEPL